MKKIAENYFRRTEMHAPSDEVRANLIIDVIDGEYLDTQVSLEGKFCISGSTRWEFLKKLGALIDEYRI